MPRFCTSCGTPVADDLSFCPQCGKPMAAHPAAAPAAAPVTPAPPVAPAPPVVSPAPAAPAAVAAPAKSSPILKIILAVVLVIVFIMVASIGACVYFGYRAKQRLNTFKQSIQMTQTRGGTPEVHMERGEEPEAAAPAASEIPVYPGATPLKGGGELSFGGMGGISVQQYETSDPVAQVLAFYKDKLGADIPAAESEGHYRLTVNKMTEKPPRMWTIEILEEKDAGKTKITISRMGR